MGTSSVLRKNHGPAASPRFPHEAALEAFSVPFLYFSGDGSCAYTSPAAATYLRSRPVGALVATQAHHTAQELCWSHGRTRYAMGHLELVRELPCCSDDGSVLALHV